MSTPHRTADLPSGECIAWPTGTGDQFTISRADPRIMISGEMFRIWHDGPNVDGVTLRCACEDCPDAEDPAMHCPVGDVVTLRGVNRTVIYRITGYLPDVGCCVAEWPD
jgi:hypothetical protein